MFLYLCKNFRFENKNLFSCGNSKEATFLKILYNVGIICKATQTSLSQERSVSKRNMSTIKKEKSSAKSSKNARRWTDLELSVYADVLADPENSFAVSLEKLALKKSANNEVFEHIQKHFIAEMEKEDTKERNSELLKDIKGTTKLDFSIEKLRQKYKWLKTEWNNKTLRVKNGSGLEPQQEARWYQIINPVFSETHKPIELASSSKDVSFSTSSSDEESCGKGSKDEEIVDVVGVDDAENEEPKVKKLKTVVPPHKKGEKI